MTTRYQERKALGLILSANDREEANAIAEEIKREGGSSVRWDRADRTPAIAAAVRNAIADSPSCHTTPSQMLEQFRRYGEMGLERGGRIWAR